LRRKAAKSDKQDKLNEFIASLSVDVAVHVDHDVAIGRDAIAIDYDLVRLEGWRLVAVRCCEIQDLAGPYYSILIEAQAFEPKAQTLFDLAEAGRRLQPDGAVHLLERNRRRAQTARDLMARVFSDLAVSRFPGGTVISGRRPLAVDGRPEAAGLLLSDAATGRQFYLKTWPGLFSGGALDSGTAVLIDTLPELEGRRVLDIGCGYGALTVTAALRGADVSFTDVDARALRLTQTNLAAAGLVAKGALAIDPRDAFAGPFDVVLSNPPTHAGSDMLQRLFASGIALAPCGEMLIVVRAHLNYEKWLDELAQVQQIAVAYGYKVLRLRPKASGARTGTSRARLDG
jgi:16S rRNA (guanine1207-N2)-methyltransferase